MRRKDREIKDYNKMLEIIDQCDCIRIGFKEQEGTYILPLNFGYESQEDKIQGLTKIMSHYSNKSDWIFADQMVNSVNVWKLSVTEWSCKEH
jgi:nitroimidazol reductase NimA-like FMN-containing flavoprotein (pyridoxamine 5'-phosphate oxidase superfamily)